MNSILDPNEPPLWTYVLTGALSFALVAWAITGRWESIVFGAAIGTLFGAARWGR